MSKKQVLVVSADKALALEMTPSLAGRGFEPVPVLNAREAAAKLSTEEFGGVVMDAAKLPPIDRESLFQIHKQRADFPLIVIQTLATLSPTENAPLRRLPLPMPNGFADQVRACGKPVVFLVERGVYASRALQTALGDAGVHAVSMESTMGLSEHLVKQSEFEQKRRMTPAPKTQSFWQKLSGGESSSEAEIVLGNVVVAQFEGKPAEAEALDARLRQSLPQLVCYLVGGIDALADAAKAIRSNFPASLMREQAGRLGTVLTEGSQAAGGPQGKPRILLVDNNKPLMETSFMPTLLANGYEAAVCMDGEQALKLAGRKGAFHLVALGLPMAFVQNNSLEVAKKLRAIDPDLGIVLMVDPHPLPTVIQAVSQAASLGLDDALIKPVQPDQLLYAIQKALKARFLVAENGRLLKETQEQKVQLEQVNGFQKKFFAMVAHDVKNPLTAILGYSEVLGMRLKEMPNELKCASHIHSAAKTLNHLISDLVDLAAIESGKLRVNIGQLDLAAVVGEVKTRVDVVAQQRQIQFAAVVPPQLPPMAGDPARIGQVIQNLCTNGIQYTKEGGSVTIRVDYIHPWVTVSVIDTGIGIKKEDLPRVFERFFQTAEAQQMRKAGFGLGLKIAREIVQMHGGDMGIESEFGKGSRFFFTLPVQAPAAAAPAAPVAPAAATTPAPAAAPTPVPTAAPTPVPPPQQPK